MAEKMKNMTLRAIAKACNGICYGDEAVLDTEISAVVTDSRKIEEDCLFVAIVGERVDGHDFIKDVYEKGAICCISEKQLDSEVAGNHAYIKVESSLIAIKEIAEYYRKTLDIKVVGITGSVGKTSTKETIASVLSTHYNVLKTAGNFNNELGLPLTIFRIRQEHQIAVLEMGISDFGEMTRLTKIAKPDICVITNIGICHLENLKTRDGILKAKTEIFTSMAKDGEVVLNADDDKLITVEKVNDKTVNFFGIDNERDVYAKDIVNKGLEGTDCTIHLRDDLLKVHIPIPGHHMIYNAMAAALVGKLLGLSKEEIIEGISKVTTISGRNNIIKTDKWLVIDDCYNANPVSMKASIDVMSMAKGRKVCILGDMFELGDNEKELHYEVGEYAAKANMDVVITAGNLSENIYRAVKDNASNTLAYHFSNRDEMLEKLDSILLEKDNILVKASHGMQYPKVVEFLTK